MTKPTGPSPAYVAAAVRGAQDMAARLGASAPDPLHLGAERLVRIDAWAAEQPDKPTRPEAVRRLVDKGLGK